MFGYTSYFQPPSYLIRIVGSWEYFGEHFGRKWILILTTSLPSILRLMEKQGSKHEIGEIVEGLQ
jgi:hypothetical protein